MFTAGLNFEWKMCNGKTADSTSHQPTKWKCWLRFFRQDMTSSLSVVKAFLANVLKELLKTFSQSDKYQKTHLSLVDTFPHSGWLVADLRAAKAESLPLAKFPSGFLWRLKVCPQKSLLTDGHISEMETHYSFQWDPSQARLPATIVHCSHKMAAI